MEVKASGAPGKTEAGVMPRQFASASTIAPAKMPPNAASRVPNGRFRKYVCTDPGVRPDRNVSILAIALAIRKLNVRMQFSEKSNATGMPCRRCAAAAVRCECEAGRHAIASHGAA
ncbi:hypothetical protein ACFSHT_22785 [Paraburkholderia silviterrae]|uniref:hypothetical protein n=1 Tax=Paraburkholderia silviterrae TaxID=2528715 RepID=UPI00140456AB|nr:hypothetical protein [Paraburkholderia silviterrae]